MEDAKDQARETLSRFRGSMQPRLTSLGGRLQSVPDRVVQNLPDQIREKVPNIITRNIPRPQGSPPRSDANSPSRSDANSPPTPYRDIPQSPRSLNLARAAPLPDTSMAPPPPPTPVQQPRAPQPDDPSYNRELAALAAKILYRSGTDPVSGGPVLVLVAGAFPDSNNVDYTALLPYVLSNLPSDEELANSEEGREGYSVVFFAGGGDKKQEAAARPSWKWTLQAYTLVGVIREMSARVTDEPDQPMADGTGQLGRAVRKNIKRLWVVHEKNWIRKSFRFQCNSGTRMLTGQVQFSRFSPTWCLSSSRRRFCIVGFLSTSPQTTADIT